MHLHRAGATKPADPRGNRRAGPRPTVPLSPAVQRALAGGASPTAGGTAALRALQTTAGNRAVVSRLAVQRQVGDGHDLSAPRFAKQPLLEEVYDGHARVRGGSDPDAVRRIQKALRDVTKKTGNTYDLGRSGPDGDGVDGVYGGLTGAAVSKFKSDHGLGSTQFTDVGPGTMDKLDTLFKDDPDPGPGPEPKPPPQPAAAPRLDFLVIEPRRGPTTDVKIVPPEILVLGGREIPALDCAAAFIARLEVAPQHKGRIFFRQYLLSTTRKDDSCRRGPKGVVKGPGLDSRDVYNHDAGLGGASGVLTVGGTSGRVTLTDFDEPSQFPTPPVCEFQDKDRVLLFASDLFRLVVIWEPEGGPAVPLAHKDWSWVGRGQFTKDRGGWLHGVSGESGGPSPSVLVQPGEEAPREPVLLGPLLMDGAEPMAPF